MLKLAKYLKPYLLISILCIACVVVQAVGNLKLPDLMSDIVNTGIQRYGIEDSVPERMRQQTFEVMLLFMTEAERGTVMPYYTGTAANGDSGSAIVELNGAPVPADRVIMNEAFGRGFAVIGLSLQSEEMGEQGEERSVEEVIASLMMMSDEEHDTLMAQISAGLDELGESVTGQMIAMMIKAEYEALGVDMNAYQRAAVLRIGGRMLAASLLIVVAAVMAGFLSSRAAGGFARDVRNEVFVKVTGFSSAEINQFSTASLITRTTNDVQQIQMVVTMILRMVIFAPIMGVGGIIYAVQKSVSMSWIIALAVIVLLGLMAILFAFVMPRFKKLQKLIDRLNQVARENISGTMVSRAYNTQDFEKERFDTANKNLAATNLFVNRAMVVMNPFMTIIMNGVMLMILWFGAKEVANSSLQVGDMMAYMQYAMHVVMSFLLVSVMFIMLPRAAVSGERVAEVLGCENSIKDPESPRQIDANPGMRGVVEFDNVSFRYPGAEENTLENISFTAKPGEVTAFIGATGSGKSTIANLLMRFYDVSSGVIKVGGVDVRELRQHDLRSQIGYIPQKSVLFTGTIDENIRFGNQDATPQEVEKAAQTAQAIDFIREKENGMEEAISQGGTNVSGGQRQRLSIARALAMKAPIYLFDDSFSALDFKTDAALRRALAKEAADSAILLVAQRVGTIRNAAQIIVLAEGRIVGKGTHAQLMQSCEIYQDIARSQLREEELA